MSATGRNRADKPREPLDFYETPAWCVDALLQAVPELPTPTIDPAAGRGALVAAVRRYRPDACVFGVELDPARATEARLAGLPVRLGDGLAFDWTGHVAILNPPFHLALAFAHKAAREARSAAMLARLGFLASQERQSFWQAHAPSGLAICSERPKFRWGSGDSADYAWILWNVPGPSLRWIP